MRLNWEVVACNIREARRQLEQIERRIEEPNAPSEPELQIMLAHSFHHLDFAWNARRVSTERYANLSDEEFALWRQHPKDLGV